MMAIKRTINEFCPKCGSRQVRFRADGFLGVTICRCEPVPGPPDPPRIIHPSSVRVLREGGE